MIAFDGLSLAGKSTMVQMLYLRSEDSVVIRENEFDPLRPVTARFNRLLKQYSLEGSLEQLTEEYSDPLVQQTVQEAQDYLKSLNLEGPGQPKLKQAAIDYFFTKGRKLTDESVREQESDVILDRWWVSGMAYQVQPNLSKAHELGLPERVRKEIHPEDDPYTWQNIRDLNLSHDISVPDMQYIIACPMDQIPQRRDYREKHGTGTSGQRSVGRENIIYDALTQIHGWLQKQGRHAHWVENNGTPTECLDEQIRQSIPAYLAVEDNLRESIERGYSTFGLAAEPLTYRQAEEFFLEDANKRSIYERQCLGRVAEQDRKSL